MIVKGTKQLGSFKRGINLYAPKRSTSQPVEQVIWKVAVFGAGTASSNGEYIWDGTTTYSGKPVYSGPNGASMQFYEVWYIDYPELGTLYTSQDLITWDFQSTEFQPAPSSALSYSPNSFISQITISNGDPNIVNGSYSRESGGNTVFYGYEGNNSDCSIYFTDTINNPNWNAVIYDSANGVDRFKTDDAASLAQVSLFHWNIIEGYALAETTNIVYSA